MGETTAIEWTDASWNPWRGCKKVSAGCKNCYMFRDQERYGNNPSVIARSKTTFNDPLKWEKAMMATGAPPAGETKRVFTCSWSDFFIEEADPWRGDAWEIIRKTPHLTYQILTKRPENIPGRLPESGFPLNIWWGITGETQEMLDGRWDILNSALHNYRLPVMFVSIEPMLEEIDLQWVLEKKEIIYPKPGDRPWQMRAPDWIICGGESGPNARPMDLAWARSIRDQCKAAGVAFFMKQLGGHPNKRHKMMDFPEDLQIREFPEPK